MRIGILGCGRIIRKHIQHLTERPEAGVVALCDVNSDALSAAKTEYFADTDISLYTNPDSMLDSAALDAVIIATPHTLHFPHAMSAIDAGCHVFLEKPMVTSSDQAYALARRANESKKTVAVGFNTSSKKSFRYLREQIRANSFGSLEMVCGYLSQNWMKKFNGSWRQNPDLSGGGQAYDSGAHILNSLLWSVEAKPEMVFALTEHKDLPVDINSVITIRFANQVLANVTISGNCAGSSQHMVFIFENGRVEVDGWTGDSIRVYVEGFPEEPAIDQTEVFPINNFVDAILHNSEVAAGIQNGINHSLLMDGIYESARTQKAVYPSQFSKEGS